MSEKMTLYIRAIRAIHHGESVIQSSITVPVTVTSNQDLFNQALEFSRSIINARFFLDQQPLRDCDVEQYILESIKE
jgi:hypothetical protein